MFFVRFCTLALLVFASPSLKAHGYDVEELRINHPFATPTVPGQTNGAVYFGLRNKGKNADRLVEATTPNAAAVEMHRTSNRDNVVRMREVRQIAIGPGEEIKMQPGNGYHLMLVSLKQPLKDGDAFPLVLKFERAGAVEVSVQVQAPKGGQGQHAEEHRH